jgi:hypothetical protein
MDTHKIIVRYPCEESDDQRKERIKSGKPLPHYSFAISGNANGLTRDEAKQMEERK